MQNKWEHVSERKLDILIDHLNTLNDITPKIKCQGREGVDPSVIMGIDSTLFQLGSFPGHTDVPHHDEVQAVTIYKGLKPGGHSCNHDQCAPHDKCMHADDMHDGRTHDGETATERSLHAIQARIISVREERHWLLRYQVAGHEPEY